MPTATSPASPSKARTASTDRRRSSSRGSRLPPALTEERQQGGPFVVFAVFSVTVVMYISSIWVASQVHLNHLIPTHVLPLMKEYLNISQKDVPNFLLFANAVFTFGVTSWTSIFFRSLSTSGFDNRNPRLLKYSGVAARAVSAHQNALEGYLLFAVAVLASQQAGVSQSLRSSFTIYAFLWRIMYQFLYLIDIDFLRSLAWISSTIPSVALLAAAAIPGFSRNFLIL
ncbi:hypothetical protein HK101_000420 [Irineochytrium annulatum]|nr:hypothetical protein HK101_000420 [Irineochytrium annulatum]